MLYIGVYIYIVIYLYVYIKRDVLCVFVCFWDPGVVPMDPDRNSVYFCSVNAPGALMRGRFMPKFMFFVRSIITSLREFVLNSRHPGPRRVWRWGLTCAS